MRATAIRCDIARNDGSDDAKVSVCAESALFAVAEDGAMVRYGCQPEGLTIIEGDGGRVVVD